MVAVHAARFGGQEQLTSGRRGTQTIRLTQASRGTLAAGRDGLPRTRPPPCACSSSTATCSPGPARTSTTPSSAAALVRAGHEVHLLCQDRDPLALDWVDAAGDWDSRRARAHRPPRAGRGRPSTGRTSAGCCRCTWPIATRASRRGRSPISPRPSSTATSTPTSPPCARWPSASRPDVALANHLVMGPADPRPRARGRARTR